MLSNKEEQERVILKELSKFDHPLGSGALKEALRLNGMELSEATVGRILREMDMKGYTKRIGYQGRTITEEGQRQLQFLERQKQRVIHSSELLKTFNAQKKKDLIDILVARRAAEGEVARLAAMHATSEEVEHLMQIVKDQEKLVKAGQTAVEQNTDFHLLLAKAARNRILYAIIKLIRQEGEFSPVLEYIRKETRGNVVREHLAILQAIEQRDPEKAYNAMVHHIESLIEDVEAYWEKVNDE